MEQIKSKPLIEKLAQKYKLFCSSMAIISGIAILIMILSTTLDTTSRYLFNTPIAGVFELNEVLLVICVYMGLAWTQIERGHIRVEAILVRVSSKTRHILNILAWVTTFLFMSILCWQTTKGAIYSIQIWEFRWGSIQMPIWWAKSLVPLGCLMLCIQLLLDIILEIKELCGNSNPNNK